MAVFKSRFRHPTAANANSESMTRAGLTFIELVIVLVILTALTGIAVQSLEPLADQSRYEATQRTLINLDEAILSKSFTPERVASYSGFVADIGRLPVAQGANSETQLAELWNQSTLPAFSVNTTFNDGDLTGDDNVTVAAGWRGPYLTLPPGPNVLRDGFGRSYGILNAAGNAAADTQEIVDVVSAGANGTINAADIDYDRDLELPGGAWTGGRYLGSLPVRVEEADGTDPNLAANETIRVRMYGPVNGVAGLVDEEELAAPAAGTLEFDETLIDNSVGPRVIVAFVTTGAMAPFAVVRQSTAKQIVLSPGMNPQETLTFP